MKAKSVTKRIISILIVAAMLFSCAVITAPSSIAGRADGKYKVKVWMEITKEDAFGQNSYVDLYWGANGYERLFSPKDNTAYSSESYERELTQFPSRVESNMICWGWFGNAKWNIHLYVFNYFINDYVEIGSTGEQDYMGNDNHKDSIVVSGDKYPTAYKVEFTKTPPAQMTVPRTGEPAVTAEAKAVVYDQYGMLYDAIPEMSFTQTKKGIDVSNGVVTITSEANSYNGEDYNLVLQATYMSMLATTSTTLTNATYSYAFKDIQGKVYSSGSLKYGEEIPKPADPPVVKTATHHYTFTQWNSEVDTITEDITFLPEFTVNAHVFEDYVSNGDATCTADGTKTATCTCGYTDTKADPGSAKGHTYNTEVLTPVSCEADGEVRKTCSVCGETHTETVVAPGHNYKEDPIAPTCTNSGYILHTCTNCGNSYKSDFESKLGHDLGEGVLSPAPTCTEAGKRVSQCSRCEYSETVDLPALGHIQSEWKVGSAPTCTEAGYEYFTCSRCLNRYERTLEALGHQWTDWAYDPAPTCTEGGMHSRHCERCYLAQEEPLEALGHHFDKDNPTVEAPSDATEGRIYYLCTNGCGRCAYCVRDAEGNNTVGAQCATVEELAADSSTSIPTTAFNQFNRTDSNYKYKDRLASLRIDLNGDPNLQALRFCSSLVVPKGVEIVDFGYVYTTESLYKKYVKSLSSFVIDANAVEKQSIAGGNYSSFVSGDDVVLTYNIVIMAQQEHWGEEFYARPYIEYIYNGMTFKVYDKKITHKSVDEIAEKVMLSDTESKFAKDYVKGKIIDRVR